MRILFGGSGQIGWLLVAFGVVFVWIFDAGAGSADRARFRGEVRTVEGTTTGWRPANLSINDVQVYETLYAFELPDGRPGLPTALDLLMPGLSVVTLARYVASLGG